MTRLQLQIVAALSLLATLVVLGAGLRGGSGADASTALVAQRDAVRTISAPGLGGSGGSGEASGASSEGEEAGGSEEASGSSPSDAGTAPAGSSTTEAPSSGGEGEAGGSGGSGASGGEGGSGSGPLTGGGGTGPAGGGGTSASGTRPAPTRIRHVFLIVLAGHGFDATFGAASAARYLNGTLRPKGTLLTGYRTLGRADLPDELALIGGQPPNASTRADCPVYREIPPSSAPSRSGEIAADGCVFPNTVTTLADQLSARGLRWRAYVEDLDRGPAPGAGGTGSPKSTCRHPASNAPDETLRGRPGDGYATRHNPFVYYHSLLDLGDCDANDGGLGGLAADLSSARATPNLSFIAPNLCDGGTESPCADGSPGGLAAADAFLARWVPQIVASPAYRRDGLLLVTFAGDVTPPAVGAPDAPVREGALLVSRYARAGGSAGSAYDPYALLRSLEDLFGLRPLARAAGAPSFAHTVLGGAYVVSPGDA